MDGEIQALRALLNREMALLKTIKEVADPQGRFKDGSQQATSAGKTWTRSWTDSPEGLRWNGALQVTHSRRWCAEVQRSTLVKFWLFGTGQVWDAKPKNKSTQPITLPQ